MAGHNTSLLLLRREEPATWRAGPVGGTDGMSEGGRNEKCGEVWGPGSVASMEGK